MPPLVAARRLLAVLAILLSASAPAAERTRLTVYTASQPEQVAATAAALARAVPEADIAWVRASAGLLTERIMAERASPQADLVLGLAASSLLILKGEGLLAPYRPRGADDLRTSFLDPAPPYSWTGMDVYVSVICLDGARARRDGLSTPRLWRDLLDPKLRGRIVMPDPTASGTGYNLVAGWLQSMGEAGAWAFMDALDANVAAYLPSGSGPCLEVAAGTHPVGLGLDMRAAIERGRGAPVETVVPADRTGWDLEAFAILASTRHPDLARRVADWAASREASALYAQSYAIVARPDVTNPTLDYPAHAEARMIRVDVAWMARNRARILAEWTRRYGAKAGRPASP